MHRLKPYQIVSIIILLLLAVAVLGFISNRIVNPSPLERMERSLLKYRSSATLVGRLNGGTFCEYAVAELIRRGDTQSSLAALRDATDTDSYPYALFVLYTLGDEDAEEKLQELILEMPSDEDICSRLGISDVIARYLESGDEVFLPALEEVASAENETVAHPAIMAIEHINDPDYVPLWKRTETIE